MLETGDKTEKPSVLVTGGNMGIGKVICEYFQPKSKSLSRTNSFDIRDEKVRHKIADMSLDCDIFFNHAYSGDNSQLELLKLVFEKWKSVNKAGYIFTTGTYGTYSGAGIDPVYVNTKLQLDEFHKTHVQYIKHDKLNFKITLMRLGMLDTERGRSKPHWPGYGLHGKDVARMAEYLYFQPAHLLVPDLVFEARASIHE